MDNFLLEREVRAPLVREGRRRHRPTLVLGTDPLVVWHQHLVQEDLVELGVAGHLHERPDVDARGLHVEREERQAARAGGLGIGSRQAQPPCGELPRTRSRPSGPTRARPRLLRNLLLRSLLLPSLLASSVDPHGTRRKPGEV